MLLINDDANKFYCFTVKNLSELNSLGWLQGKKEVIIYRDNDFKNALDDALISQTTETYPERISKLKVYINKYNWEGKDFSGGSKEWQKFERSNKTITLNVLYKP